jgi:hypothetical protein
VSRYAAMATNAIPSAKVHAKALATREARANARAQIRPDDPRATGGRRNEPEGHRTRAEREAHADSARRGRVDCDAGRARARTHAAIRSTMRHPWRSLRCNGPFTPARHRPSSAGLFCV